MRVSTGQLQRSSLDAMLDQQSRLGTTQLQLSTGKRILSPSDDPAATARILNLKESIQVTEQYQENVGVAIARLNIEETVFESMGASLLRVRELALQGNNGTNSAGDRHVIAAEVRQRLDELLELANTRDASGEFIFAGFQGRVQPFSLDASGNAVYSGDDGQRFVQIGANRQVAVGDSGTEVFRAISNGNGSFSTLDNASNNGTGVIDPGSVTDPLAYDSDSYTITFPVATTASNTLTFNDTNANDTLDYVLDINGTTVYSVDETGTPVNTLSGLAGVINDDTGTTGVRAYVAGGNLYLANVPPSETDITVTESLSGDTDGDLDTATGYFGSALTGTSTPSVNTVLNASDATFYVVEDSSGNLKASGSYADGGAIAFNGIQTNIKGTPRTSDAFTINPSTKQDLFATLQNLITALESNGSTSAQKAGFNNAINRSLTDLDQAMENAIQGRAEVGARLKAIDSQSSLNIEYNLQTETTLSGLEDLDFTEAISRFNMQRVALEAAQQSYVKIQGLSLFNYLN